MQNERSKKIIYFKKRQPKVTRKSLHLEYVFHIEISCEANQKKFLYVSPEELDKDSEITILRKILYKMTKRGTKNVRDMESIELKDFAVDILYYANTENKDEFMSITFPKIDDNLLATLLKFIIENKEV